MKTDDLEDAVGVWERSRWDAQPWLEARMNYSHQDNLQHFRNVVARENEVWLALENGSVVGLVAVGNGKIDQLYVEPGCQRKGVGTALLNKAKELAPSGLTLFTHQRNQRARDFYENRGFQPVELGISPAPESEPDVKYLWDPAGPSKSTA